MIDDYLFYFALMALAAWSVNQVNKEKEGLDKESSF
jgi:hypothetical protein